MNKVTNGPNRKLVEGKNEPIIKKFQTHKACWSFKDNIWGNHLALMQLIRQYQEGDKFCVIDIYSKYAWIIL